MDGWVARTGGSNGNLQGRGRRRSEYGEGQLNLGATEVILNPNTVDVS